MPIATRIQWAIVLGLAMGLGAATPVHAQRDSSRKVQIPTFDGVELQGTLFPAKGGTRDACVMLLHNFDTKRGGSSHQDGWDTLAEELQKDGFTVLSFDFRGFGESKTITQSFWQHPHNQSIRGAKSKTRPDTIDQKDFPTTYYPILVNDIVAAKAYLDRQSDLKSMNSSNVMVIGAGEGATLGALWMASQFHLQRQPGGFGMLDEADGRDLVCAVWLTMTSTIGGRSAPAHLWLQEVAKKNKVPTLLVYGKDDRVAEQYAFQQLRAMMPTYKLGQKPTEKGMEFTRDWAIKGTKLTGSQLLNKELSTIGDIKFYLNDTLAKRGAREQRNRELVKSAYYWHFPPRQPTLAKRPGDEVPSAVPLRDLKAQ